MSSQASFSSPPTPLNVEFSAKAGMKEPQEEAISTPPESDQTIDTEKPLSQNPSEETEQPLPDPVAVSKSLRRVRASGSLIIEASRKKQDEMNKIIAQAIEGAETNSRELTLPAPIKTPSRSHPAKQSDSRMVAQSRIQSLPPGAGGTQTVSRRPIGSAAGSPARPGSLANPAVGMMQNAGGLSPNGPSSVLAQASGLNSKPGYRALIYVGMVIMAVMLLIFLLFQSRYLTQPKDANPERDLKRVEDQSEQYLKLGARDRDQGQYESALGNFQQALLLTPNNPDVHFQIAQTYFKAGLVDEALKAYKAVLRIAPERLEARLQVAQIYQARGNWNAAYQEYQRIIALDQSSNQAAVALEKIEAYQATQPGSNFPIPFSASRRAQVVSKNSLELPPIISAQGQLPLPPPGSANVPPIKPPARLNNKSDENLDPISMAAIPKKLGLRYLAVREYPAAINEFLAALRLTPDDRDIYYFLGSAYFGLGQFALAHDYYKRVDRGQYVQVAQSGARRTEKAAREELKRRVDMIKNDVKNEAKKESGDKDQLDKSIMNEF